jgi:alditol oxidase
MAEHQIRNWAGNVVFAPARAHQPKTVSELQKIVASASSVRALGSGHSFSRLVETSHDLVSLAGLPPRCEVDTETGNAVVSGALRYGELAPRLHAAGRALHNTGSLPHIAVVGACSTGTHGSGDRNGCLATAVTAFDCVVSTGEVVTFSREAHPTSFDAMVVSLGLFGVITAVTLETQPTFDVTQTVWDDMDFEAAVDSLDTVLGAGNSVSLFTTFRRPVFEQVWVKQRVDQSNPLSPDALTHWNGAKPARTQRHPVPGHDGSTCTTQQGVAGPWHERLPHFRLDFTPSAGDELQSEYFVPRDHGAEALRCLFAMRAEISPLLLVSEVRSVAADQLWLSMAYERDSVALHFTWLPDEPAVRTVLARIEAVLEPFQARAHWGKVFTTKPANIARLYPRFADFRELVNEWDPQRVFQNEFILDRVFG